MLPEKFTYTYTEDSSDPRDAIEDLLLAYRLISSLSPVTQEQLIRIAASVRDNDPSPLQAYVFRQTSGDSIKDEAVMKLYLEAQFLLAAEKERENRHIGRRAIALANLVHGGFDQSGCDVELYEPLREKTNVVDLFWSNHANICANNVAPDTILRKI